MNLTKLILLAVLLCFFQFAFTQSKTITGKITDITTGVPLSGVSVKLKSGLGGAITSKDGDFTIQAKPNDVLLISSIGYSNTSFDIKDQTNLSITLEPKLTDLSQIVLVGTRTGGRIKTESPVPIDIIQINQAGVTTAKMDLTSVLNYTAPSFNYNKQSGADGADHVDLGTLRGLGPDQTLVLINGKRRHQTAFVALFGTRGRGNSGADLNAFPEAAVDRIEILRDGASAQYGSDAMAGIINILLKKDVNHWTINTGWSGYYDKKYNAYKTRGSNQYYYGKPLDGNTYTFSANNGLTLGKNGGFINFSLDYLNQGKTLRQVIENDLAKDSEALPLNGGRRAFGDGSIETYGAMYNMELPMGANASTTFYSFGGYNYKASDAYAYTRNYSGRPERFPVDANGDLIFVPEIMRKSDDGETYYNPHIQTHINDASLALGLKGSLGNNWNWDLSNTIGRNNFNYFGDRTFNASNVGKATPTHFDDGGFNFLQNTANFDVSKSFSSVAKGLNLGLGAEYRYERYSIYEGEFGSYGSYRSEPIGYASGDTLTPAPGSQGFPGFSPADVVKSHRSVIGAYIDAELNATDSWLLDAAIRVENYSDFGFVSTYKLATRFKLADNFNIRGSVSSGYRAPSLQQINFSNTLTSFSGSQLVQSRIARNGDAITVAAGIPKLKDETSVNSSVGFTWKPVTNLTFTLDGYLVKVKNRIVLSGLFSADDASLPATFTSQLQSLDVATAQFFDNAVNTTNTGLDIVIDYNKKWGNRGFKALLAGNVQNMVIDKVHIPAKLDDSYRHRKTFFSDREEAFLKASAPKSKFSLSLSYDLNKIGIGTHLTYFGNVKTLGFGYTGLASAAGTGGPGDPDISGSFTGIDPYVDIDGFSDQVHVVKEIFDFKGKLTTDIYASYKFSKSISLYIGADNLFNVHPDLGVVPNARAEAFDNESGGPWDSVQMGFNGLRLFSKLALNF